jgi:hypothetical protein
MNYNIDKLTVPTQIEYTVDENRQYGQLPMEMLMTKFEETDMGDEEGSYDDYARNVLTNWGPDTNFLAHEEPRGGVEARGGLLNLRYYGHRGVADNPYHPEVFIGFQGPEDWDPRGTADEPDMKKIPEQWASRMRFVRFSPDGCEQITGGSRNEWKVQIDNQSVFKWIRDRMKWFSTQKDGRREGIRRLLPPKPDVKKVVVVRGYGDYIKDFALNPQRRSVLISDNIIRNSQEYRANCRDQDDTVMLYGESGRKRRHNTVAKGGAAIRDISNDGKFSQQEVSKCYKAVGLLLSELVRGKSQEIAMAKSGDTEHAESTASMAQKSAKIVNDLSIILRSITADNAWGNSEITKMMKSATPKEVEHMARLITFNHLLPANHYFNAELMYKSVIPGADKESIRREVISDSTVPDVRDTQTIVSKMARMRALDPRAGKNGLSEVNTESTSTHNYKHAKAYLDDKQRQNTSGENFKAESRNTQARKQNHENYQIVNKNAHVQGMAFHDNQYMEHGAAKIGSKYVMRDMDRDGRDDSVGVSA